MARQHELGIQTFEAAQRSESPVSIRRKRRDLRSMLPGGDGVGCDRVANEQGAPVRKVKGGTPRRVAGHVDDPG